MAIDKALNQAPMGLDMEEILMEEPALEIEIEDPESVSIEGPGFEIDIERQSRMILTPIWPKRLMKIP